MEEEALRNYCNRMISRVGNKRQRRRTDCDKQVVAGEECRDRGEPDLPLRGSADPTSPCLTYQGPGVQTVPPQLISLLRFKTFKEVLTRAAEAELHDPAACAVCEQERASLALRSFIRRKETQLRFQNTDGQTKHRRGLSQSVHAGGVLGNISQSPSVPLAGFGRNYLLGDVPGHGNPGLPWQPLRNVELPW